MQRLEWLYAMSPITDKDKHAAIVEGLIRDKLRDWVVQHRPGVGIQAGGDLGTETDARSAVKRGRGSKAQADGFGIAP
jgi:hypothetical protein